MSKGHTATAERWLHFKSLLMEEVSNMRASMAIDDVGRYSKKRKCLTMAVLMEMNAEQLILVDEVDAAMEFTRLGKRHLDEARSKRHNKMGKRNLSDVERDYFFEVYENRLQWYLQRKDDIVSARGALENLGRVVGGFSKRQEPAELKGYLLDQIVWAYRLDEFALASESLTTLGSVPSACTDETDYGAILCDEKKFWSVVSAGLLGGPKEKSELGALFDRFFASLVESDMLMRAYGIKRLSDFSYIYFKHVAPPDLRTVDPITVIQSIRVGLGPGKGVA